jgi:hypothetical protein
MTTDPASSARRLVERARGRAFRHEAARAVLRGITVSALLGAVLVGGARLLGERPAPWFLAVLAPGVALAIAGIVRSRPTLSGAALLLDRAAETKQRFTSALEAEDAEVRDLVARQATEGRDLRRPPLTFPPSTEGLAAALSVALLAGALLVPHGSRDGDSSPSPGPGAAPAPAVASGAPTDRPDEPASPSEPARSPPAVLESVADRLASGERLSEEEWRALEEAGLSRKGIDAARAEAARGEGGAAAERIRRALRDLTERERRREPSSSASWPAYAAALANPDWSPRFDRFVRRYFRRTAEEGLR